MSFLTRLSYGVLFLCVAAFSLYSVCDLCFLYGKAAEKSGIVERRKNPDEDAEARWPDGCVARICIENTDIDYPVMQAADNTTYINLDEDGEYSLSGSIFLDYRCSPDFDDGYSMIYGHHMEYGLMFGALDRFQEESYFDAHRESTLTFRNGRIIQLKTVAMMEVSADCPEVFERPLAQPAVPLTTKWVRDHAHIYRSAEDRLTEGGNGQILALSTCSGRGEGLREVLICVQVTDSK